MITPPVAIASFAAANLAGADPMRTGYAAMRFRWTVFVIPFLFVFSGTLLMKGDPFLIAVDFVAAVAGVWLISAAMMGYSVRRLGVLERLYYGIAGLCVLIPLDAFGAGRSINMVGVALIVLLAVWELRKHVPGVVELE